MRPCAPGEVKDAGSPSRGPRDLGRVAVVSGLALGAYAAACQLSLPSRNLCFEEHVVPLIKRDCAACHENGEYGVKLVGQASDHAELARYVLPYAGARSPLIAWADGDHGHPPIWGKDSAERGAMTAWIDEGGGTSCFDRERYGDCRDEQDCEEVSCICADGDVAAGRACHLDPGTGRGTCATPERCEDPVFGLCAGSPAPDASSGDPDGGGPPDAGPPPDTRPPGVSFALQITPMNRTDCARCHSRGQWNVRIAGTVADYPEVMRYVDQSDPEAPGGYLWWAAGGGKHPVLWTTGGAKYRLFLDWVLQGAQNN